MPQDLPSCQGCSWCSCLKSSTTSQGVTLAHMCREHALHPSMYWETLGALDAVELGLCGSTLFLGHQFGFHGDLEKVQHRWASWGWGAWRRRRTSGEGEGCARHSLALPSTPASGCVPCVVSQDRVSQPLSLWFPGPHQHFHGRLQR